MAQSVEMEMAGKPGVFVCNSSNAFTGNGAWVYFREETVVATWSSPKSQGASLAGTYPANSSFPIPTTSMTITSGTAIIGKCDL